MLSKKIEVYNSLSDEQKYIVHLSAVAFQDFNTLSIKQASLNRKISEAAVKETFFICSQAKIIVPATGYNKQMNVDPEFMVWVMPLIDDLMNTMDRMRHVSRGLFYNIRYSLSDYLYTLLCNQEHIPELERSLINHTEELAFPLSALFMQPAYAPILPLMHPFIVGYASMAAMANAINELEKLQPFEVYNVHNNSEFVSRLYVGDFNQKPSVSYADSPSGIPCHYHFMEASRTLLIDNEPELAVTFFEKGMKRQRSTHKGTHLPIQPEFALYFLSSLLTRPSEIYAPLVQKIIDTFNKKRLLPTDICFEIMCYYLRNEERYMKERVQIMQFTVQQSESSYLALWAVITLFFIGEKPKEETKKETFDLIDKARRNGYLIQALEASYALTQWWENDKEIQEQYESIQKQITYRPALSLIERQEDWEKNLNMLLGIGAVKGVKAGDENKKCRVVYFISPSYLKIQPVLQTLQANGSWSGGRNIALKTFANNKKGMTEQDYRIAGHVRYTDGGYYGSITYELEDSAYKDLAGHPYVFLEGGNNIPVEIVEGKPTVSVTQNNKKYLLSGHPAKVDRKFFVQKETNTRYVVYSLSDKQFQLLVNLNAHTVAIPEKGTALLTKVLAHIGTYFTVHSDLIDAQTEGVTGAQTVPADSRIRVQLLPFGNGLKAELFTKPFGEFPPYCKPGIGGKSLISSQNKDRRQTVRDLKKEKEYADVINQDIQLHDTIEINDDLMTFDNPLDSLYLLEILAKHQDIAVVEWPEGAKYKIKRQVELDDLRLKVSSGVNWFEVSGELEADEKTVLNISQLLELSRKGHGNFVELGNGEFLALSEKLKKQLDDLNAYSQTSKKGVQINKTAAIAVGNLFDECKSIKTDKAWKEFRKNITRTAGTPIDVPENLQAELRSYQEEGFRWMVRLSDLGAGACLADDMGLGKTVQTLTVLLHRAQVGPALVVCPVSVLPNWLNETRKFAPSLNVKTLLAGNRADTIQSLEAGDLLVVSYGLLQSEEDLLSKVTWTSLVLDEAHTIKNYTTKTSQAAMSMQAAFKLALTGTPVQNHLGELWNLFNFINPGLLGGLSYFTDHFMKADDASGRKRLKKLIAPFILRRTKSTVLDELPPKIEIIRKIRLSDEEAAYYEALRRQAVLSLEQDAEPNGTKHLKALAEITRLRQACCNPALVNKDLNIPSSKLSTFIDIVSELKENNHRPLVFSQFVTHLALVKEALDAKGLTYQYLDGSTPMPEREQSVKRFQSGESDMFLISLKAGGLGLNLTAADFIIHLDPWWNPAVEDQASDRAHRIGQTRPVTVYRLVAENTIEEKIIQLHNTKRDLADSLLEGSDRSGKMSVQELMQLIKGED